MKKVLYMHSGSGNHGCEAIIRTTSQLLGGPKDVILWTDAIAEDRKYESLKDIETTVVSEQIRKYSISYFEALIRRRVFAEKDANLKIFLRDLFKNHIAISVGGDTYCYPWSAQQSVRLGKIIRKYCARSVLWACSIDPGAITSEVREDLAGYDLITARESLTYCLLKPINPNTVKVADPAFLLERVDLPLPENFIEENTVGINVSPLIMKYGSEHAILSNYENLIHYIIHETEMNVCLIPHVVWNQNNDGEPIRRLYEKFACTGRICKIEDGTAPELKGYIARCRYFIGARTHATIAAYSSCIPTLAVGYSVKSKGISQDLFGTDENYVIPVQYLKNDAVLKEKFIWLIQTGERQKNILEKNIPAIMEQARSAKTWLDELENR